MPPGATQAGYDVGVVELTAEHGKHFDQVAFRFVVFVLVNGVIAVRVNGAERFVHDRISPAAAQTKFICSSVSAKPEGR